MARTEFEERVEKTVEDIVHILAEDGLVYPQMVLIGMSSVLLQRPELMNVEYTSDVDILPKFLEDVEDIADTLEHLVETGEIEGQVLTNVSGTVEFISFEEKPPMPVDFTFPEEDLRPLFEYVRKNARDGFTKVNETQVYVAKLEDALLCKAAIGREKDAAQLTKIIPELGEDLDRNYFWKTTKERGVEEKVSETFEKADIDRS